MADKNGSGGVIMLGVAGIIVYEIYKKFVNPDIVQPLKMKANVERMRIGKLQSVQMKKDGIQFKFPIENPNNDPLVISAIVGDVYISDHTGKTIKIGAVDRFGKEVIKPLGATNFDLNVRINPVAAFVYFSQIFAGKWQGIVLAFNGTVNANGRPWPVKEAVKIA